MPRYHGHVLVNDRPVDIASYRVKLNDVIRLRDRSKALPHVSASLATPLAFQTPWLSFDAEKRVATVIGIPEPSSVPFPINVQRVVEYYSQRT